MDLFKKGASSPKGKRDQKKKELHLPDVFGKVNRAIGSDADEKAVALRLYWVRFAIGLLLFIIGLFALVPPFLKYVFHILATVVVGRYVFEDCLRLIRKKSPVNEKLLICLAVIVSFLLGKSWQGAVIMIFYVLAGLLQDMMAELARSYTRRRYRRHPGNVTLMRSGEKVTVAPEEVEAGDILAFEPGQMLAVDALVVTGVTEIDTSAVMGEDSRTYAEPGAEILSGSVNLGDEIKVRALNDFASSHINRVAAIEEQASRYSSGADTLVRRIMGFYVPAIAVLAVIVGLIVPILSPLSFRVWLNRAVVLLASAGVGGVFVALSVAYYWAVNRAGSSGIAMRSYDAVDGLASTGSVMFGKTGVLTEGRFEIVRVAPVGVTEKALLKYAAYTESYSSHPMANAVIAAYDGVVDSSAVARFYEQPGKGVILQMEDKNVVCAGNEYMMEDVGVRPAELNTADNALHLSLNRKYIGYILLRDNADKGARTAVSELRDMGIDRVCMFTGEKREPALAVAESVGISEVYAEFRGGEIADKLHAMVNMQPDGDRLIYVGTGTGDKQLLKTADVGIKIGGFEPEDGFANCDVAVLSNDLTRIPQAIAVSEKAKRMMRLSLIGMGACKLIVLILGILGAFPAWIAPLVDAVIAAAAIALSLDLKDKGLLAVEPDEAVDDGDDGDGSDPESTVSDQERIGFGWKRSSAPEPLPEQGSQEDIGLDIEKAIEQQFDDLPDVIDSYEQDGEPVYDEEPLTLPETQLPEAFQQVQEEPPVLTQEPEESDVPAPETEEDAKPSDEPTFKLPDVPAPVQEDKLPDVSDASDMEFTLEDILKEFRDQ